MSEERREAPESPNSLEEEATLTPEEQAELSRRVFLRRTAEVAALALFGPLALDAVIRRVAQRVAEIDALDGMAREAAEYLAQSGLGGIAYAKQEPHECRVQCSHAPPFGGCTNLPTKLFNCGPPAFNCPAPNGQQQFYCTSFHFQCGNFQCNTQGNPPQFVCEDGYKCPSPVNGTSHFAGNIGCQGAPETMFHCAPPAQFTGCPGTENPPTGKVLCGQDGGAAVFGCVDPPTQEFSICFGHGCAQDPEHNCDGIAAYQCVDFPNNNTFECTDTKFDCGDTTQSDFACNADFRCDSPNETFTCDALHLFLCQNGHFDCEGGGGFTCKAGGQLCNQGGVGGYNPNYDEPGDFMCVGEGYPNQKFDCDAQFDCASAADDFRCWDMGNVAWGHVTFTCSGQNEFACTPVGTTAGQQFQCLGEGDAKNPFACPDRFKCEGVDITFQCGTGGSPPPYVCNDAGNPPDFACGDTGDPPDFRCDPQNQYNPPT